MATKNPFGKCRNVNDPYFTLTHGDWSWKVLKLYKSPANTLKDRYARAFCAVSSPFTHGSFDLGDTYVSDVPGLAELLRQHIADEEKAYHEPDAS